MSNYLEYQKQITTLQELAGQARHEEVIEARKQIRELMKKYRLKPADLTQIKDKNLSAAQRRSVNAKYRDPASGKTWSGRGRTPRWLDGLNREEFLIPQGSNS